MPNVFAETISAAIADLTANGFDSETRIAFWSAKLREAAKESMISEDEMQRLLKERLTDAYIKMVDRGGLEKQHSGIPRFTIEKVKPQLRAELDRRILAAANLIKLNRTAAVEKTIQRFQGWATSIPKGGSNVVAKGETKDDIRKALASLPYEERRVIVDQGHKFAANLSDILATDGGAIAAIWRHHHVTYPRPEHVERDGDVFLIRDSWAHREGLVKPAGPKGYTDSIEMPGELPLCRCTYSYYFHLRDLPQDMLTAKGKAALAEVRSRAAA